MIKTHALWKSATTSADAFITTQVRAFLTPGKESMRVRFEGAKILGFFESEIFDQFWSSTAPALRFLAVSRFLAPARPPISATLS